LESPSIRVHLAGRISIEVDGQRVDQQAFPGQQGRLVFAFLVAERSRPVARSELADLLWPEGVTPAWETALSAIVSKLRGVLGKVGLDGSTALSSGAGCYEVRFPGRPWVDLEIAADAIHEAEVALRRADPAAAYGPSAVAHHIARRPLLPGEEGAWIDAKRAKHRGILIRALECRAEVYLWNRELSLAVEAAKDVVALEPFRETGYQLLMRAHAAAGNAGEALWAYERCRKLLADELGVDPSPQTKEIHLRLIQSL
jgi:SARP family transcriptional regulator, regulator of embCAB operon